MDNRFGCLKAPHDKRDILLESIIPISALPPRFDNTEGLTPVRHQKNEGTCVGFAMATGCMEYWEKEENQEYTILSPRFLYYHAQKIDGNSKPHEGTHLLAACKVAQTLGTCREELWSYIPKDKTMPENMIPVYADALRYRIRTYTRVRSLDTLKQAIFDPQVDVVLIGVKVYKGMISEQAKKTGVVPNPSFWDYWNVLGGHALCAASYEDASPFFKKDGHVKVKNSWGTENGDKGFLYLSYKYIKSQMLDAYACVDIRPEDLKNYAFKRLGDEREWIT